MTGILVTSVALAVLVAGAVRADAAWKLFSFFCGVSSFVAVGVGMSGGNAEPGWKILGGFGPLFIGMTVFHYVNSLPADRSRSERTRQRSTL